MISARDLVLSVGVALVSGRDWTQAKMKRAFVGVGLCRCVGLLVVCWMSRSLWGDPPRVDHRMPLVAPVSGWVTQDLPMPARTPLVTVTALPGQPAVLMLAELGGIIWRWDRLADEAPRVYLDLTDRVVTGGERGLCSVVFHPGYATNGQFFVYYCRYAPGTTSQHVRVSRFSVDPADPTVGLPASELPLITQAHRGDVHFAGDMRFGPDGYLYISLGDEGYTYGWSNAGRWDLNFFSGILRIDPDHRSGGLQPNPHPAVHPGAYLIPPDNPYINRTKYIIGDQDLNFDMELEDLRTEFWAVGFRNPWRITFDSATGDLYANDVGVSHREEINRVRKGTHHGWYWKEGTLPWPFSYPASGLTDPVHEYEHTQGRVAITGGHFHRDPRTPALDGSYVFADWTGQVYAMPQLEDGRFGPPEMLAYVPNVATITEDPMDGSVLLAGANFQRLVPVTNSVVLPQRLSETGLFESVTQLKPAAGLQGYHVNQPFWSDHAIKSRWFGLPTGGDRLLGFESEGSWNAPEGTVWVKHFDFPVSDEDPTRTRRLETRVIVKTTYGVYGVTYRWNPEGTEAGLVDAAGAEEDLEIETPSGTRIQRWRYPSRTECLTCHTATGGHALSFNTAQMNRAGVGGTNQLLTLLAAGYFAGTPEVRPNLLAAHPDLADEAVSLEHRVRSYLAVNCSYCHQPGSGNRSPWDGRVETRLEAASIVGQLAIHQSSTGFTIFATNIVEVGSASGSVMYRRLSEMGPLHMPPLGTSVVNTQAVGLLSRWIEQVLPNRPSYTQWVGERLAYRAQEETEEDADPDDDGDPNLHEYLVGTDPVDPRDRWRPSILSAADGTVTVRFPRRAHRDYRVETALQLSGPWQPVDHPSNRSRWSAVDEVAEVPLPSGDAQFVRVRVISP